ncbi:MAG: PCRF domain-containing protein, partial [Planctomycetaceae bacterium]|nr:PCRF domain-containing protein [Planctomycetaceae bacterium]
MKKILEDKLARFTELEFMMTDPDVLADSGKMQSVAREHGQIAKLATKYRRFKQLNEQIEEAGDLLKSGDSELKELAEMELPGLKEERETLWNELLDMTIGGEDANRTNCMIEIRAGT